MKQIIVTRPLGQQADLIAALQNLHWDTLHIPLLSLEPLPPPTPLNFDDTQIAIFISPASCSYAEQAFSEQHWQQLQQKQIFAIGSATAQHLKRKGLYNVLFPQQANSEGLLELTQLADIQNQRIILVCGQGGRRLIEEELSHRGAEVQRLELYQRQPLSSEALICRCQQVMPQAIWLLTSQQAMEQLIKLLKQGSINSPIQVIVSSYRLKKFAQEHQLQVIGVSEGATNEAILEYLKRHKKT